MRAELFALDSEEPITLTVLRVEQNGPDWIISGAMPFEQSLALIGEPRDYQWQHLRLTHGDRVIREFGINEASWRLCPAAEFSAIPSKFSQVTLSLQCTRVEHSRVL